MGDGNLAVPDGDIDDLSLDNDFGLGEQGAPPEGGGDGNRPEKGGGEEAGGLHGVVCKMVVLRI